jgi:hypothetical protein
MNKKVFLFAIISLCFASLASAAGSLTDMPIIGQIIQWIMSTVTWPPWNVGNYFGNAAVQIPVYLLILMFFMLFSVFRVVALKLPFFKDANQQNAITVFSLALAGIILTGTGFVNTIFALGTLTTLFILGGTIVGVWGLYVLFFRTAGGALSRESMKVSGLGAKESAKLATDVAAARKEKAVAREVEQEANIQEQQVGDEQRAIGAIDKLLKKEEWDDMDEIKRLQWCDQVLERISRIRNAVEANKYRQMVEQQLAVIMKEVTNDENKEGSVKQMMVKVRGLENREIGELRDEAGAESMLQAYIEKSLEKKGGLAAFQERQKSFYDNLLRNMKQVMRQKVAVENQLNSLLQMVDQNNAQFNNLIKRVMEDIAGNRIVEASHGIHDAISLKQREASEYKAAVNLDVTINRLLRMQQDDDERLKTILRKF